MGIIVENKVYIVMGVTSNGTSRTSWIAGCFKKRAPAKQLTNNLNNWCIKHELSITNIKHPHKMLLIGCPPEDRNFQCWYEGVHYYFESFPLQ